jgi:hypothetical protein
MVREAAPYKWGDLCFVKPNRLYEWKDSDPEEVLVIRLVRLPLASVYLDGAEEGVIMLDPNPRTYCVRGYEFWDGRYRLVG